jgi:small-conductance mechanosensitive channel
VLVPNVDIQQFFHFFTSDFELVRTFGIIVVVLGVAACVFAILLALDAENRDQGTFAVAAAIGAVGIVGAGGILLHHSN